MTCPTNAPIDAPPAAADRLARTVRVQRLALVVLAGSLMLAVGLGIGSRGLPTMPVRGPEITHYTAGGDRLYRIWDNGTIEYLIVDFANGSVEGIPGWASVHIDNSLTRDRMGNVTRVSGR